MLIKQEKSFRKIILEIDTEEDAMELFEDINTAESFMLNETPKPVRNKLHLVSRVISDEIGSILLKSGSK